MTMRTSIHELVTTKEMHMRDQWAEEHLWDVELKMPASRPAETSKSAERTSELPFAFLYDGKPSDELLAAWPKKTQKEKLNANRTQHTIIWTDPRTGLEVRCVAVEYADFPAIEWTVYFRNTCRENTPILENIQGLDTRVERGTDGEFVLHGAKGDSCSPDSFQPFRQMLELKAGKRFVPVGGRPTNGDFPYYNLQMPGGGMFLAVGWPGQWAASFTRDDVDSLRIVAGQELTRMSLKPGETVRAPLVALLFWQGGDVARSHNLWRRWMLAHNSPRPGGKRLSPMFFGCGPTLKTDEATERQFIDAFIKEKVKLDYWWIDAGWYPCSSWVDGVGTWEVDKARFPGGIKAISDYVHTKGMKQILWFEPERVAGGTWLAMNHPEWLLSGNLLDLGNPEARAWLTDHVARLIREQGIDLYRQDFNMDPLDNWRNGEAADRQGMRENLYVQGHLAYWDELRRRHTDLLIDSCAAGGRRIDLETLRRAVGAHTRSDFIAFDGNLSHAPGNQGQTFGLSFWLPYYGQGVYYRDQTTQQRIYNVRSYMGPAFGICVDVRRQDVDWDLYRKLVSQFRQVAELMLADYYPLTPWSIDDARWIAWQFHRPETGEGMVQAFRRGQNEEAVRSFYLNGLDPLAHYEITDIDAGIPVKMSGKDLMEKGLAVEIKAKPCAALITYRKAD